jgi:hypothetical protein
MTYRFDAFGVVVGCNEPIPGLRVTASSDIDVRVDLRPDHWNGWRPRADERPWYETDGGDGARPWLTVWRDEAFRFEYAEGAVFTVEPHGGCVVGAWQPPLTHSDAVSFLTGPVLAFVLRLRGVLPLHASAVSIDGRAVVFLGAAGAGKSSLAAAFGASGVPVLSDDVVPVRLFDGRFLVDPGFPRLSLWPDTAAALFGTERSLPVVSDTYAKHVLDLSARSLHFCPSAQPLDRVFVLGEHSAGVRPTIVPMSRRDGLLALLANTYGAYLLDAGLRSREFGVLSELAAATPPEALALPHDLLGLRRACAWLSETIAAAR